jgi:hypothetical protein
LFPFCFSVPFSPFYFFLDKLLVEGAVGLVAHPKQYVDAVVNPAELMAFRAFADNYCGITFFLILNEDLKNAGRLEPSFVRVKFFPAMRTILNEPPMI